MVKQRQIYAGQKRGLICCCHRKRLARHIETSDDKCISETIQREGSLKAFLQKEPVRQKVCRVKKRAGQTHAKERRTALLDEPGIKARILRCKKLIEAPCKAGTSKTGLSPLLGLLVERRDIFIITDIPHRQAGTVACHRVVCITEKSLASG